MNKILKSFPIVAFLVMIFITVVTARADAALVPIGLPVTLTATADGTPPFSYVWSKAGAVLPGKTQSTLAFATFAQADLGDYSCKITNPFGSAPATITLTAGLPPTNPKITPTWIQQVVAWVKNIFAKIFA